MKQLLDNGTLVTLGIVGVVAAVGAANKAGLYGSTGSAARGRKKVTMRPLADYIPGKYRGRVIGDASYVESHNLDRREIEEIKLYLEENGFTVSVETSDAPDTFGHRTVIRAMPVPPLKMSTPRATEAYERLLIAEAGAHRGQAMSDWQRDATASDVRKGWLPHFGPLPAWAKSRRGGSLNEGSAARGLSFGWAQVKGGHVVKVSNAERKPTGTGWGEINTVNTKVGDRASLDGGTVYLEGGSLNEGSAARGVTEGYVESYLDGDNIAISTFLNRHLRGKAKQFAGQYARRLKAALDALVVSGEAYRDTTPNGAPSYRRTSSDSGTAGSAARALRGPPHAGPSVKRMVDFLKIPKVHAAAVKARMDDGVPYKAILEVVDELMDGNGVEYIDSHADTMRSQDGLSYVNLGDTYDTTLLYDHKTGRFSVGSWGDIVEKQPARFR